MMRSERDHEAPLASDVPGSGPATTRVRSRSGDSRVAAALWVVALLIGFAIVKPWGPGSPESTRSPAAQRATDAPVTLEPTEDLTDDGLAAEICLGAGAWQVASLESWRTQDVRVWRAIEPLADARGPADPEIPSVPIIALSLEGLGWCAPTYGARRPIGPATVEAWYVRGGLPTELPLLQVRPADGETSLAALYLPLATCAEQATCDPRSEAPLLRAWVTGRVVFRYRDAGSGGALWFAAELEIVVPASPLPSGPATSPAAQPS